MNGRKNGFARLVLAGLIILGSLALGCSSAEAPQQPAAEPSPAAQRKSTEAPPPGTAPKPAEPAGSRPSGSIEIRKSWVQIRKGPSMKAEAIGLAYGNDTFVVLKTEGDWVQVRFGENQLGWIPLEATRN